MLQAEQIRLDIESEKVTLNEKIKILEIEKEKVEMELGQITRERNDLSNQLSVLARKKETLNEDLMRHKQKLEQSNEMNARINRNLKDLVKDNEEKQARTNYARDNRRVTFFFINIIYWKNKGRILFSAGTSGDK